MDSTVSSPVRHRLRRDELRGIVMSSALRVARAEGLGLGAANLTFKRVFEDVRLTTGLVVTNASVINRLWRNLDEFRVDVLVELVREDNEREYLVLTDHLLRAHADRDLTSLEARRASLAEMARVACNAYVQLSVQSQARYQLVYGLYERSRDVRDGADRLHELFLEGAGAFTERYGSLLTVALESVGWRVRDPFNITYLTTLFSSIAEGIVLHRRILPDTAVSTLLPTGPHGELVEWTPLALTVNALLDHLAEPLDHWRAE